MIKHRGVKHCFIITILTYFHLHLQIVPQIVPLQWYHSSSLETMFRITLDDYISVPSFMKAK